MHVPTAHETDSTRGSPDLPQRRTEDHTAALVRPVESIIEVFIGRITLFTGVMLVVVAAVAAILWVSAIASWRSFGFVVTAQDYSYVVTCTAIATTVAFLVASGMLILQARKNRR